MSDVPQIPSVGNILCRAGLWLELRERLGEDGPPPLAMGDVQVDLVAWCAAREGVEPEDALRMLRGGYLFRELER